jgi:hypothetical protein
MENTSAQAPVPSSAAPSTVPSAATPVPASTSATPLTPPVSSVSPISSTPPMSSPEPQSGGSRGKVLGILIVGVILAVAVGAGAYYGGLKLFPSQPTPTLEAEASPSAEFQACTLEAKVCPDGTSVGRSGPSCEFAECPKEVSIEDATKSSELKVGTTYTLAIGALKADAKSNPIPGTAANITVTLPAGSKVGEGKAVVKNVEYTVVVDRLEGLCPNEDFEASMCGYKDEKFPLAEALRVWKDKTGIFALNPYSISKDGYYLNNIVVMKSGTKKILTAEEIADWKQIFSTLAVVKTAK